jgi:SAM-dependent methyltransferase
MNYNEWVTGYYDHYVKFDADIPFFIKELAGKNSDVLELMSGTGRLSLPLVAAGVNLTCVDSSPAMLQILRNKLEERRLSARVCQQDICKLNLDSKFDFIIIPFHSFAEIHDAASQTQVLGHIYRHLQDDGCFICTLHNPAVRLKSVTGALRLLGRYPLEENGCTLLVWSAENYNLSSHIVEGIQIYEEYDGTGAMTSRRILGIKFSLLEHRQFESLATSAGFKVSRVYGDYAHSEFDESSSPVMIFMLHK